MNKQFIALWLHLKLTLCSRRFVRALYILRRHARFNIIQQAFTAAVTVVGAEECKD